MDEGVWRTIGGKKIFIRKGQDLASAMKESGKFKTSQTNKKTKEEIFSKYKEIKKSGSLEELQENANDLIELYNNGEMPKNELDDRLNVLSNTYYRKSSYQEQLDTSKLKSESKKEKIDTEKVKQSDEDISRDVATEMKNNGYYDDLNKVVEEKLSDIEYDDDKFNKVLNKAQEDVITDLKNDRKEILEKTNELKNLKEHNFIKEKTNMYTLEREDYYQFNKDLRELEDSMENLKMCDDIVEMTKNISKDIDIETSKKSISTYIDTNKEILKNEQFQSLLNKSDISKERINEVMKNNESINIRISDHEVGGKFNMESNGFIDYSGGDFNINLSTIRNSYKEYLQEHPNSKMNISDFIKFYE